MAHYAFLDSNNIVTEVITGVGEDELIEGLNPEIWYGNFRGQTCKRTSYNTIANVHRLGGEPFRKNYAGIGYYYDEEWDAFRPPREYPSWKLNYETFLWEPPIPMPESEEGFAWKWGEINQEWVKVPLDQEYDGDGYNLFKWTAQDWVNVVDFYLKSKLKDTYPRQLGSMPVDVGYASVVLEHATN